MIRAWWTALAVLGLAGCVVVPVEPQAGMPAPQVPTARPAPATPAGARESARAFIRVISRMEPAVERE